MKVPDLNYLIPRYLAGESAQKLGKELGISPMTVSRRFRQAGVKLRTAAEVSRELCINRFALRIPNIADVLRRYESGERLRALAEELGVTWQALRILLAKNGARIRTGAETLHPCHASTEEVVRLYQAGES